MYQLLFVHAHFHSTQMNGSSASTRSGGRSVSKRQMCCSYKLENLFAIFPLLWSAVYRSFIYTYHVFNELLCTFLCMCVAGLQICDIYHVHLRLLAPSFIFFPPLICFTWVYQEFLSFPQVKYCLFFRSWYFFPFFDTSTVKNNFF